MPITSMPILVLCFYIACAIYCLRISLFQWRFQCRQDQENENKINKKPKQRANTWSSWLGLYLMVSWHRTCPVSSAFLEFAENETSKNNALKLCFCNAGRPNKTYLLYQDFFSCMILLTPEMNGTCKYSMFSKKVIFIVVSWLIRVYRHKTTTVMSDATW